MKTTREFHSALGRLQRAVDLHATTLGQDWTASQLELANAAQALLETIQIKPLARASDPRTSQEAAESIDETKLKRNQMAVLAVLRFRGASTDEALVMSYMNNADAYCWPRQSPSGIRTRRKELTDMGLVELRDKQGINANGRKVGVYRAVAR